MAIVDTELIAYQSAEHPQDEEATSGGAINTAGIVTFSDIPAAQQLQIKSSSGSDTAIDFTVHCRLANGVIVEATGTLNGMTPVVLNFGDNDDVARFLDLELSGAAAGTVTLECATGEANAGDDIAVLPPGITSCIRLFRQAFSDPSNPKDYYEKLFWKNTNGSLALLDASVVEVAGGAAALVTFALADTIDDTEDTADRLTAPTDVTAFGNGPITLDDATSQAFLDAGEAIGVWVKLSLTAGNAPVNNTWTSKLAGTSA